MNHRMCKNIGIVVLSFALFCSASFAWAEPVTTIRNNGDSTNRVDLVIVGEGYTEAELPQYATDVEAVVQGMFEQEPFKEYQHYFNIHRVDVISNESGADHPNRGFFADTAFDAIYQSRGFQNFLFLDSSKVYAVLNNSVDPNKKDIRLVIVNDSDGGGVASGGIAVVGGIAAPEGTSSYEGVPDVALHEIGHSFGLLGDEYDFSEFATCNNTVEPSSPNLTTQTQSSQIKWNNGGGPPTGWIDLSTPIPTPWNINTSVGVPGLFEGGQYCFTGVFRPTANSKMHSVSAPFEQINEEQLVKRIYNLVSPLESSSPVESTVTIPLGESLDFQVEVPAPLTDPLAVTWLVNDQVRGSGPQFTLDSTGLIAGSHIVEVVVKDQTHRVRYDPANVLSDKRQWSVTTFGGVEGDTTSVRYVRLVADSAINGNPWTSVAELTILDGNGTPLDKSGWTLQSVDSEELVGENGAGVNAFDGNPATIWHTAWSGLPGTPHQIIIDLGSAQTVSGFRYLPRQDGGTNGRIADYRFYGSSNGVQWGFPLATGTFTNDPVEQQKLFPTGVTSRVSISSSGQEGDNYDSEFSSISADGRYVTFESKTTNLVAGDSNGKYDIFVHDRETGSTVRVSVSNSGEQGDGDSRAPKISADGRFVGFSSKATNLVAGDTNGAQDGFVYDRQTGTTVRVSVSSSGAEATNPGPPPDSAVTAISWDGRYVVFNSNASNLVAGDTNGTHDVFVRDRQTGITERVSVSSSGEQGDVSSGSGTISADGRYVAFSSSADNLVSEDSGRYPDVFVHDRQTGTTARVNISNNGDEAIGFSGSPAISADGRYVAFRSGADNLVAGDSNERDDVFVHDRQSGVTSLVNISSSGEKGNAGVPLVSPGFSADGRYVTFVSGATNLVTGDTNGRNDIFVHDRQTGVTERVSVSSSGEEGVFNSSWPSMSAGGRYVTFSSDANNLVAEDTNGRSDVFVHERGGSVSPLQPLAVTFSGSGSGTVTSNVAGISCGTDCSEDYLSGSLVTLTASPASGSVFTGWGGGTDWSGTSCSGTGMCTVIMTKAHTVAATFTTNGGGGGSTSMRYVRLVADSEFNGNPWTTVAELTVLDGNGTSLDQSSWTLQSVDSEEVVGENGAAVNAFDGNPATFWHTQWLGGSPSHPHEIIIDLGTQQAVSGFGYLPRQDGGTNGRIAGYRFYGSSDGASWGAPVATGTFANTDEQQVVFGGKRYVRLVAASEVSGNPWTTVAELTIIDTTGTPLEKSGWTLQSVDSEELAGENGAAVNAFDGNPSTIWHTQWSGGSPLHPHEIIIDLGVVQTIGGFRYLPRQDGGTNGRIGEYQFYGSADGMTWSVPLASGAFADTDQEQEVLF